MDVMVSHLATCTLSIMGMSVHVQYSELAHILLLIEIILYKWGLQA